MIPKKNYEESLRKMKEATPTVDRYNNLHPDTLHREWLKNQKLIVFKDGTTRERRGDNRGRPPGRKGRCSYCKKEGHYACRCPKRLRDGGMTLG